MCQLLTEALGTASIQRFGGEVFHQQKAVVPRTANAIHSRNTHGTTACQQRKLIGFSGEFGQHLTDISLYENTIPVFDLPDGVHLASFTRLVLEDISGSKMFIQ